MKLKAYFDKFPRGKRGQERRRFAELHGVSEVTVRSWANGTRRHPCSLESVRRTESFTKLQVTRHDLRPDIFSNADQEGYSDSKPSEVSYQSNLNQ